MQAAQDTPDPHGEHLPRMSFGDHLDELRSRLVRALLAIVVSVFAIAPFKSTVTDIYMQPYRTMWNHAYRAYLDRLDAEVAGAENLHEAKREVVEWHRKYRDEVLAGTFPEPSQIQSRGAFSVPYTLKALGGLEDFWTFMSATLLFALIVSSPVVVYQLWAFVAAGLYKRERDAVLRYVPLGMVLLIAGILFGYFIMVPYGLFFLVQLMDWTQVEPMLAVSQYFSILLTLTAALGVVSQTPLVMLALQKTGLVTHEAMRKNWRYVILVLLIIAAVLTPPDPFTLVLMATPMVGLYGLGLILTANVARKRPKLAP